MATACYLLVTLMYRGGALVGGCLTFLITRISDLLLQTRERRIHSFSGENVKLELNMIKIYLCLARKEINKEKGKYLKKRYQSKL